MEFTIDISDEQLADALGVEIESVEDAFSQLDNEELEDVLTQRALTYARKHSDEVEVSEDDFSPDDEDDEFEF